MYGLSISDKSGDLAWPAIYVVKVMFSALVLELITLEQLAIGSSNFVDRLIMWHAMYNHWQT